MDKIILKRTENYNEKNETNKSLSEINIYSILEFKINTFWKSSNWGPPQRRTLTKNKSDGFNKVLSTEFRPFKRILALLK